MNIDLIEVIFIGVTLAICAGFRAFVPLFIVVGAVHVGNTHIINILNPTVKNLIMGNELLIYLLGVLAFIEIMGDKSESIGNFLEAINLVLRPLVGAICIYSFIIIKDPIVNFALALVAGVILAVPIHSLKANARLLSKDAAFSDYNVYLSVLEDIESLGGAVLAIWAPMISIFVVPAVFLTTLFGFNRWKKKLIQKKSINAKMMNVVSAGVGVADVESLLREKRNMS